MGDLVKLGIGLGVFASIVAGIILTLWVEKTALLARDRLARTRSVPEHLSQHLAVWPLGCTFP